ncbi:hypothetical protein AVEN_207533-1 [Araneus ventricosus]|uniref:Uncharacterized protein n=1 Tax=Araneus ventricosus TaxID=182803 RepID=A0A4Y2DD18_ARAVE|nr:hypothetical protein AVEN_267187-1 [Araneus ventricosus]GBM14673.1 hypothetical protein AVEN_207533-1 [Araneus ventricosus]
MKLFGNWRLAGIPSVVASFERVSAISLPFMLMCALTQPSLILAFSRRVICASLVIFLFTLKDLRAWRLDSLSLQMLTSSFAVLAHSMAALRASISAWNTVLAVLSLAF